MPSGIVAWWQGEGNGLDSTGGNNATLMNATSFANGEVGSAFNLNGVNNFLVANPSSPSNLDVGQAGGLTFEEWIKPNTVTAEEILLEYERFLGVQSGADIGIGFAIHADSGGILYANLTDTNYVSHEITSPGGLLTPGVWQHVALTYDKASGQAAIYLNGATVSTANFGSFTPITGFTNLLLGARTLLSSANNPGSTLSGEMDEISLYNRALSSNEIATIYLAGGYGKCSGSAPPMITAQPTNQVVPVGGTATFAAIATGAPLLSYQWSLNGTNINGATNSTLTLANAQTSQSGSYSVFISNDYGSTNSTSATLTVVGLPPFITSQPTNQTLLAGGSAIFSVTATGTPTLTYQWSVNGTNIIGATNATLTLNNAQSSQSGSYSAFISNAFGSTNSTAAHLAVSSSPSCDPVPSGIVAWWQGEGNGLDSVGGNNATLMNATGFTNGEVGSAFNLNGVNNFLVATPSSPSNLDVGQGGGLTFEEWIKPNSVTAEEILLEYERFLGVQSGADIGIGFAIHADSGGILYANLTDTNYVSHEITSPGGLLTPGVWQHVALTYDKTSGQAAIYLNGAAVSTANFGSFTPITGFTNLLLGARTLFSSASNPGSTLSGEMDEISLYNRALSSNEIATIYLAGSAGKCSSSTPPIIATQPTNQTVVMGGTAVFTVGATGTPTLTYQWSFDGTNINGATNATLNLSNVQLSNAGDYSVLINNLYGSTNSASATLTVVGLPPFITSQPTNQTLLAGGTAVFSVTATGTPTLTYQWSVNGTNIIGATNATLALNNAQSSQSGSYSAFVANAFGSTNSTAAVLTITPPPSCDPVPSGIVAWWAAEGNAFDGVSGNNGTLMNGTTFTNGEVGSAFQLNGSGNFILVNPATPSSLDVGRGSGLTFEEWINPNNVSSEEMLIEYERYLGASSGLDAGIGFAIHAASPTGILYANLVDTNYVSHEITSPAGLLTAGVWQHVALTYDKTSGRACLYLNGSNVALANLGAFTPITSFTNVLLGARALFHSASSPGSLFSGRLDEISLYNRALSSNEIAAIYQAGSYGKCQLPPTIVSQPTNQSVLVNGMATFAVGAVGAPPLVYQWSCNGTNLPNATNSTLILTGVQLANAGTYSVLISDTAGATNSAGVSLTVLSPLTIAQQPQSATVLSYSGASFSVAATGTGPISYQWQKNGTNVVDNGNLTGSTTANLTLASVSVSDAGNYTVVLTTPYSATNSAVAVLTVPQTLVYLTSTNKMSGNTVVMPVMMNALGVENSMLASVGYDPTKLALKSVQLGHATAGAYLQEVDSQTNNGYVGFAILLNTGSTIPAGTQEVADVIFQTLPVTNTTTVNVTFGDTPTSRQLVDNNLNSLPAIYQAGSIQLTPAEYCADVYPRTNGDHVLNLQDWLEVGRMVAGLDVPTNSDEFLRADCAPRNAPDGLLTTADWVQAGRYALGLDPLTLVTAPASPIIAPKFKPAGGPAPSRTLFIGNVTAQRGAVVNVPVQLICATNENAAGWTVGYNTNQLRLLNVSLGSSLPGGRLNVNSSRFAGKVGVLVGLSPGATLPAGTNQLAVLQFLTTTNGSGSAPITLDSSVVNQQIADQLATPLATIYVNGAVTLPPQPFITSTVSGSNLQFSWSVNSGTFQVQSADQPIGPWTSIVLPLTTNGGNVTATCFPTNQQQYFRLQGQ